MLSITKNTLRDSAMVAPRNFELRVSDAPQYCGWKKLLGSRAIPCCMLSCFLIVVNTVFLCILLYIYFLHIKHSFSLILYVYSSRGLWAIWFLRFWTSAAACSATSTFRSVRRTSATVSSFERSSSSSKTRLQVPRATPGASIIVLQFLFIYVFVLIICRYNNYFPHSDYDMIR